MIELPDRTLLEMDARFVAPLIKDFQKYLFNEQVQLIDGTLVWHQIGVHGPAALEALNLALDQPIAPLALMALLNSWLRSAPAASQPSSFSLVTI